MGSSPAISFESKKTKILAELNRPADEYTDLSPKGSIDEGIRELLDFVNSVPGLVSTSSCAGRVSVFREGAKQLQAADGNRADQEQVNGTSGVTASSGGKGGGDWLFVSHDPISDDLRNSQRQTLAGILRGSSTLTDTERKSIALRDVQYVHFKFEAMILHILTASLEDAQAVLAAAAQAGFRESGAMTLSLKTEVLPTPLVAVRSAGMGFDSIIAVVLANGSFIRLVDDAYLETLISVANERFRTNSERIARFRTVLSQQYDSTSDRENPAARRARKRAEGLAKQRAIQVEQQTGSIETRRIDEDVHADAIFET